MSATNYPCIREEKAKPDAPWLLARIAEVQGYLRRKRFSEHAIDTAVLAVYVAALPYLSEIALDQIDNPRAWVFKVAIRAANRASVRQIDCTTLPPALVAATVKGAVPSEEESDLWVALTLLTPKQRTAVELCILNGMSRRAAAKEMDIAVSTLCGHLSTAMLRLKEILLPGLVSRWSKHFDPSAPDTYR